MTIKIQRAAVLTAFILAAPVVADACACGCGVFGVGAGTLFPLANGGEAYVEYDFMNQNRNFSGDSRAPAANNDDKQIKTDFYTVGGQYMISSDWGVMVEVPVWNRLFRTENDAGNGVDRFQHAAIGDVRLMGVYTGLSKDKSTGITFGLKLPTGDWTYPGFDRDTEIGSGSTDLLVGAYHVGSLTRDERWGYFGQVRADVPFASQGAYRPGEEVDAAAGVSWAGLGRDTDKIRVTPILQMIGSARLKDSGVNSNRDDSGYERLLVSPGVEVSSGKWKLYGDVEFPVYQHVNGNQLTAPLLVKAVLSRAF